jgi:hypothetical protein
MVGGLVVVWALSMAGYRRLVNQLGSAPEAGDESE